MINAENITAFLIHSRDYKNNSKLLDFLTDDFGLIRLVANGVKNQKIKLQQFIRLSISFSGRSSLKTLRTWEIIDSPRHLTGDKLFLGIYINELITRLVSDESINLCDSYDYFLEDLLNSTGNGEWQLRLFEDILLSEIGYGVDFVNDNLNNIIQSNSYYNFKKNIGFIPDDQGEILGKSLIAFANKTKNNDYLMIYKKINRLRIKELLGGKPLNSKKLF